METSMMDTSKTDSIGSKHNIDVVNDLLLRPFVSRTSKEQHDFVKNGRPTPELRVHPRHFSRERYYIHPWLSGSYTRNCIVCWPCLLFKPNPLNVWTNGSFNQMNTFTQSAQSHQCSPEHAEALILFNHFEHNVRSHELEYIRHNEEVQKNRDILKRLIDICSLINQDFSFGRSDQSGYNTSNAELLQYITPLDDILQEHLESTPLFYNMTYNIQDNILLAINGVIDQTIKQELSATKFIAVMVDELSDVGNQSQISITVRYVNKEGIKERLLGIYNILDKSANGIAEVVVSTLEEFKCLSKLVAHAYDGASLPASELQNIQSLIKKAVPGAILVHCYAHDLNHALRESVSFLPQCKVFFSVLQGIATFFNNSTKHSQLLDRIVCETTNDVKPIQWKHQWTVNIVSANRGAIIQLLEQIIEQPNEWDTETISSAKQLLNTIEDFEFTFLLTVFATVFERMYTTYQTLKEGNFYLNYCSRVVGEALNFLSDQYKQFEEIYEKVVDEVGPPVKRKVARQIKEYYKMFFIKVIDCLKLQLELRFAYIVDQKLQFNSLMDPTQFEAYSKKRFDQEIRLLRDCYEKQFDFSRLKSELAVLYKRELLYNKPLLEIHNILSSGELASGGFNQVLKLAELILTIPTASVIADEQAPIYEDQEIYLTRIKKYCQNISREDRVSSLAKMTVEKELVIQIKKNPDFQELVTEEFLKKVPLGEFAFK